MKYYYFLIVTFSWFSLSCNQQNSNRQQGTPVALNGAKMADTVIHIIWRKNEILRDASLSSTKDTVSVIVVNKDYCEAAPDVIKAAIGFAGTFIGSDCNWDGQANDSMTNLSCKLISALGLGYQCSEKHLGFLRKWLRNEPCMLKKLEDCPIVPFTASSQDTFDNMDLLIKNDTLVISYSASGIDMPVGKTWTWTGKYIFRMDKDKLHLIFEKESKPEYAYF